MHPAVLDLSMRKFLFKYTLKGQKPIHPKGIEELPLTRSVPKNHNVPISGAMWLVQRKIDLTSVIQSFSPYST